jgi:[acyl-carrier-protein] S-malonyltransferase
MGRAIAERHPEAAARFAEANDVLGFDLRKLCFEGPEEELKKTEITQPALFAVGFMVYECFVRAGVRFDVAAGHSLGEYTALAAAKAFDFATGLRLVRKRGELMSRASSGAMAAVLGFDSLSLQTICSEISASGNIVVPANYNAPDQIVISGSVKGVETASAAIKAAGAKRVVPLAVSGAFHSPLMQEAADSMKEVLAAAAISDATAPVISNVTAAPVVKASEIRDLLVRQLVSPVRFVDSFKDAAAGKAVEIGPGKVVCGLVKKINPSINLISAHTPEEVVAAVAFLGA